MAGRSRPASTEGGRRPTRGDEVDVKHALARKAPFGPVIEQAKGMLMLAEGCTGDEAFHRLRTCSEHANRKVGDLARDLIESVVESRCPSAQLSDVLSQLVDSARSEHVTQA